MPLIDAAAIFRDVLLDSRDVRRIFEQVTFAFSPAGEEDTARKLVDAFVRGSPHPDSMPGPPSSRFCDCVVARSSALEFAAGLQGLKIPGTVGVDLYRFAMVFPARLSCANRT